MRPAPKARVDLAVNEAATWNMNNASVLEDQRSNHQAAAVRLRGGGVGTKPRRRLSQGARCWLIWGAILVLVSLFIFLLVWFSDHTYGFTQPYNPNTATG
jgi:hypothetical protein